MVSQTKSPRGLNLGTLLTHWILLFSFLLILLILPFLLKLLIKPYWHVIQPSKQIAAVDGCGFHPPVCAGFGETKLRSLFLRQSWGQPKCIQVNLYHWQPLQSSQDFEDQQLRGNGGCWRAEKATRVWCWEWPEELTTWICLPNLLELFIKSLVDGVFTLHTSRYQQRSEVADRHSSLTRTLGSNNRNLIKSFHF